MKVAGALIAVLFLTMPVAAQQSVHSQRSSEARLRNRPSLDAGARGGFEFLHIPGFFHDFELGDRINLVYAALSGSQSEGLFLRVLYRVAPDGSVKDFKVVERECPQDYESLCIGALKEVLCSPEYRRALEKSPMYLGARNYTFRYYYSKMPKIPKRQLTEEEISYLLKLPSPSIWAIVTADSPEKFQLALEERWINSVNNNIPESERFPRQIEKVVCKLLIEPSGYVRAVSIEKSCGDAGCDARAIALLKKYQPYNPPPNAKAADTGLLVYFDGDMGITFKANSPACEPPFLFHR